MRPKKCVSPCRRAGEDGGCCLFAAAAEAAVAFGQLEEDCAGLRKAALAVLQHGCFAHRVDGFSPGGAARLTVEKVDELSLPGQAQLVEHEGNLEGAAGLAECVQSEHESSAQVTQRAIGSRSASGACRSTRSTTRFSGARRRPAECRRGTRLTMGQRGDDGWQRSRRHSKRYASTAGQRARRFRATPARAIVAPATAPTTAAA